MGTRESMNYLALSALATVVWQTAFALIAITFKFDKVTDLAYGLNFAGLAVYMALDVATLHYRQLVVATCVAVWGVRLAGYLFYRILCIGHDARFDERRDSAAATARFFLLQTIAVWVIQLPMAVLFDAGETNPAVNWLDYTGFVVFALGLIIEAWADHSKFTFKRQPNSKGWCTRGLWKYSRHPNYAGDIMVWWGVFGMCVRVMSGAEYATVASPLIITLLLLFVSGIPLLEESADKRYGKDDSYLAYKRDTPALWPMPRGLWRAVPAFFKRVVFCELHMYNTMESQPITGGQ